MVTTEHGKTLDESRGSVRRGIECVEVACGAPSLLMGYGLENVATGIDCAAMRQPIGVCAAIAPFNFPAMVPLWFLPFAVVCGNTFVLKPSEQVPLSMRRMFELLEQCDLPPGVVNLVNGGREVVEAICDHPGHPRGVVRRIDAGGARSCTSAPRTPASASRPSAAPRTSSSSCRTPTSTAAIPAITESFYGCAGERCLAGTRAAARRPGPRRSAGSAGRVRARAEDRRRARPGRDDGAGDQREASRARAELRRSGRVGRRGGSCSTAERPACRTGRTASSSAPPCSTTSRRPWRLAATRSSDPSRRCAA